MKKYIEQFVLAEKSGKATGLTGVGSVVSYKIRIGTTLLKGSNPINSVGELLKLGYAGVAGAVGKKLWSAILEIPKVHFDIIRNAGRQDNKAFSSSCSSYLRTLEKEVLPKKATKKEVPPKKATSK